MIARAPRASGPSLARRLATLISLGLGGLWLVSVGAMALVLREEQTELYDQQLVVSAEGLLPVLEHALETGVSLNPPPIRTRPVDADEELAYRLIDRSGQVLDASAAAAFVRFPDRARPERLQRTETHMVYTTAFTPAGHALQFADPLVERAEAWRDSFAAFLLPMLAILPLGWLAVGWITRMALRPLEALRAEMARRDSDSLSPLDAASQPRELAGAIATLNGFMARLAIAIEGERSFATNAAHELRTPVAVALAQLQRLAQETTDPDARARIATIEAALHRMARLVGRLLQLARADAGIGRGEAPIDAARLLHHVLAEIAPPPGRLALDLSAGPVWTRMDADALAIVAGNLIENALQHGPADAPVEVTLTADGSLCVRNGGPALSAQALAGATRRFVRRKGGGFGLGLDIATRIARQAGTRLDLSSPIPGRDDGFEARLHL